MYCADTELVYIPGGENGSYFRQKKGAGECDTK